MSVRQGSEASYMTAAQLLLTTAHSGTHVTAAAHGSTAQMDKCVSIMAQVHECETGGKLYDSSTHAGNKQHTPVRVRQLLLMTVWQVVVQVRVEEYVQ